MAEQVLATCTLTKRYGSHTALDAAGVTVEQGMIYGLVGRNGAGKTTLIRIVSGQAEATSGELFLFGVSEPGKLNKVRRRTGAMVETPSFYPYLTAAENLEYYRRQRGIPGKKCVQEALDLVGLGDTGKKKFKAFSLGMKQRLGLGLALMNHPDFLLLDEPINGLDPEGIVEFRNILLDLNHKRGTTILISSHIRSELANLATHYCFLDKGHVLEEISAAALREKCRACLQVTVDDTARASVVLEQTLGSADYEVLPGGVIRLYTCLDHPETVTSALARHGVAILGVENRGAELEDYFLKLIGGGVRHA